MEWVLPSWRSCLLHLRPQTSGMVKPHSNLWTAPEQRCVPKNCLQRHKKAGITTTELMTAGPKIKNSMQN